MEFYRCVAVFLALGTGLFSFTVTAAPLNLPASGGTAAGEFAPSVFPTFADWKRACELMPSNRAISHRLPPKASLPLKTFGEFEEVINAFFALSKHGTLGLPERWIDWGAGHAPFFDTNKVYFTKAIPFQPYAMKLSVPADAEVIFHGDFHGDVRSFVASLGWLNTNKYLEGFKLSRSNLYMVFLGDYTDRGMQGVEVLYTLYRLKLANPDRVILARGNHEDISLAQNYGFLAEGNAKYARAFNAVKVLRAYDFFPTVVYVGTGTNYIQCNHGGMEAGYDPGALLDSPGEQRFQMLGALNQSRFAQENPAWVAALARSERSVVTAHFKDLVPQSPVAPETLGFMWNDFSIAKGEAALAFDALRPAIVYGEGAVKGFLEIAGTERNRLRAVFRAHQHSSSLNSMMKRLKVSNGIFRHWQNNDGTALLDADETKLLPVLETSMERAIPTGSVWTFNVAPDTYYGEGCKFNFDTMGILKVAEKFDDWRLRVVNVQVVQP